MMNLHMSDTKNGSVVYPEAAEWTIPFERHVVVGLRKIIWCWGGS